MIKELLAMRSQPTVARFRMGRNALAVLAISLPAIATATPQVPYASPRLESAPYAGYVNHAHTAPTFHWGWFGAERYAPQVRWHRDYNGNLMRWNSQRRY